MHRGLNKNQSSFSFLTNLIITMIEVELPIAHNIKHIDSNGKQWYVVDDQVLAGQLDEKTNYVVFENAEYSMVPLEFVDDGVYFDTKNKALKHLLKKLNREQRTYKKLMERNKLEIETILKELNGDIDGLITDVSYKAVPGASE